MLREMASRPPICLKCFGAGRLHLGGCFLGNIMQTRLLPIACACCVQTRRRSRYATRLMCDACLAVRSSDGPLTMTNLLRSAGFRYFAFTFSAKRFLLFLFAPVLIEPADWQECALAGDKGFASAFRAGVQDFGFARIPRGTERYD